MKTVMVVFLIAVAVVLFNGCSGTRAVVIPPKTTTLESRECVKDCQRMYAECVEGCSRMEGGLMTALQRGACLDNCTALLEGCYLTCE